MDRSEPTVPERTVADTNRAGTPGSAARAGTAISIRGLTVRAGGQVLLEDASAEMPARSITLILGPSGAGKSILLRLLAGLLRPGNGGVEAEGEIAIGSPEAPGGAPRARVGMVFQNFALFDELGAVGNVLFGWDHRPRRTRGAADTGRRGDIARQLLRELDIPAGIPVALLSGGQRQRLAIARTLAYDADVVLFDEPTSGLDPAHAAQVAGQLRATRDRFGKTTVVATHDFASLAAIADQVLFLDPARRTLRPVAPADVTDLWRDAETGDEPRAPAAPAVSRRLAGAVGRLLASATTTLEATLACLLAAAPLWRSVRWGLRYLAHFLWLLASPSSLAYFAAAGVIAGFVATYFTFEFLPFRAYTEPLITEELLHGLGFALYRIVVPVLLTVLLAARCGAAVAADIGGRVYASQTDAMRSLGARPQPYLLTNILYAFLVATPLVVLLGFGAARVTSLLVFSYNYPEHGALFWDAHFHRNLHVPGEALYLGTGWLLVKILACGLGVGGIAYHLGMRPKRSSVEVSRTVTVTIIWATLFVLLVHFTFAFIEF